MKISSPSRNTSARKPSHLGSKIQLPSAGNSSTRFASIGRIGGFSRRSTPHGITWLHLLIAAENEPCPMNLDYPSPFRRQPKSVRTPQTKSIDCIFAIDRHVALPLRADRKFTFSRLQAGSDDVVPKSDWRKCGSDLLEARFGTLADLNEA